MSSQLAHAARRVPLIRFTHGINSKFVLFLFFKCVFKFKLFLKRNFT